jgi:hypothetical protein
MGMKVQTAHTCHATHGGVVVVGPMGKRTALFYLPNQTRTSFLGERIDSAHQELQALQGVESRIAAYKAARKAPHGLVKGDILEEHRNGVTLPWYHMIVDVPSPRHATIVRCPSCTLASGWEGTTTVPDPGGTTSQPAVPKTVLFRIEDGVPMAPIGNGRFVRPWNGKPHHRSNDG